MSYPVWSRQKFKNPHCCQYNPPTTVDYKNYAFKALLEKSTGAKVARLQKMADFTSMKYMSERWK